MPVMARMPGNMGKIRSETAVFVEMDRLCIECGEGAPVW